MTTDAPDLKALRMVQSDLELAIGSMRSAISGLQNFQAYAEKAADRLDRVIATREARDG